MERYLPPPKIGLGAFSLCQISLREGLCRLTPGAIHSLSTIPSLVLSLLALLVEWRELEETAAGNRSFQSELWD